MDGAASDGSCPAVSQIEEVIATASRLARHDTVKAVHVAFGARPTYAALLRFRRIAEANGLTLVLHADAVVLRPRRPSAGR